MLLEPLLTKVAGAVAGAALAAVGAAAPVMTSPVAPPAASRVAPAGAWRWPLPGTPPVVHPFAAPPGPYAAGHRGVDLGAAAGTPVLAPAAGVVTLAGSVAGVPVVVVTHDGGLRSTFQPVAGRVPVGTRVAAGTEVGTLTTDPGHCAPTACLHWGVLHGTTYLDPLRLLRPPRVVLLPVPG